MNKKILSATTFLSLLLALFVSQSAFAQQAPIEGTSYYLPKTALRFSILIEKTTFTPGEYARYAERYMKLPVREEAETSYRVVGINMSTYAMPDSNKHFTAIIDHKHTLISLERDENGILKAINAKGYSVPEPAKFTPAPKAQPLNPHDFMTEDILSAASSAKMAELIAREIYDIRDSRNQLSRGEADFMPKDGEQLRLMLGNLSTQEQALLQVFAGTTEVDTTEHFVDIIPNGEVDGEILFRVSKHLGLVSKDDVSGTPYYIYVRDMQVIPTLKYDIEEAAKRSKEDIGINVNLPGKIQITLSSMKKNVAAFETLAAQYGRVENLSANLFNKKYMTRLTLDPVTGNVDQLITEPLE